MCQFRKMHRLEATPDDCAADVELWRAVLAGYLINGGALVEPCDYEKLDRGELRGVRGGEQAVVFAGLLSVREIISIFVDPFSSCSYDAKIDAFAHIVYRQFLP